MENSMRLNPIGSLWRDSWKLYAERFNEMVKIFLVPAILLGIGGIFRSLPGGWLMFGGSILNIAGALVSVIASAGAIYSYHHKANFDDSYRAGAKFFWPLIWIAILGGLAAAGGFVLLVVPGIWLGIGFVFNTYVLVIENKRGMAALATSREYVKGYWWATLGRMLLFGIAVIVCYIIIGIPFALVGGMIGNAIASLLVTLFLAPFSIAYHYTLYQNFTAVKPQVREAAPASSSRFIRACQIIGLIFFALLLVLVAFGAAHRWFVNGTFDGTLLHGSASLSPASGAIGTSVTITLSDGTFAPTSTVLMDGLTAVGLKGLSSPDGHTLTFNVPSTLGPNCKPNEMCAQYLVEVQPGQYLVDVANDAPGYSGIGGLSFTVTQ